MRTLFVLLGLVLLWSCDPVKRSLKRKAVIDAAIADYVSRNPPKVDTLYKLGEIVNHYDTIVNENIYVDTIRIHDTVYVRKMQRVDIIKTIMQTDTMIRVILDDAASAILRTDKDQLIGELKAKDAANKRQSWAIYLLLGALSILLAFRFIR